MSVTITENQEVDLTFHPINAATPPVELTGLAITWTVVEAGMPHVLAPTADPQVITVKGGPTTVSKAATIRGTAPNGVTAIFGVTVIPDLSQPVSATITAGTPQPKT